MVVQKTPPYRVPNRVDHLRIIHLSDTHLMDQRAAPFRARYGYVFGCSVSIGGLSRTNRSCLLTGDRGFDEAESPYQRLD